jgi:hypothetical protein
MRPGTEHYRVEQIKLPPALAERISELAVEAALTDEEMMQAMIVLEVHKQPAPIIISNRG